MAKAVSTKRTPGYIWIPPKYTANYRVTVERDDGTIDDVTPILMFLNIKDGVTEGIGTFEFEIPNPNETYSKLWNGMEIFRYYSDYGTEAETLRFRGRVEKSSNRNNNILVTGRSESLFVMDQFVHKEYLGVDIGVIIKDLFDTYGQGRYDTSQIPTTTGVSLTLTFLDIPFWDVIEEVCLSLGYDCYVSANLIVKLFEAGSITNEGEAIVHDFNLVEVGDFAQDLQFVKNQIRVIGGTIDGVQVTHTSDDEDSQVANGIRREVINDDGITTYQAARELADFTLANRKDPPIVGEVKGILLATIQPGEKIRLSSPMENIQPNAYRILSYIHELGNEGLYTIVKINKEGRRLSHVLKDRIQRDHRKTDAAGNLDDLDFSEIELFNAATGTSDKTEIIDGVLALKSGESTGTWVSNPYGTASTKTISKLKVNIVGDNLPGATIDISYDGGVNYATVTRGELVTVGVGSNVVIKLTLTTGTQINSLVVQYSKAA